MQTINKAVFLTFILSISAAFPVLADQIQDLAIGSVALANGNYATALSILQPIAEKGNADAQVMVGMSYEMRCEKSQAQSGKEIDSVIRIKKYSSCAPQDYIEAVKWYQKSSVQKNAYGQWNLGNAYYLGHGVEQDYTEAAKWYRLSAAQGNSAAIDSLNRMFKEANVQKTNQYDSVQPNLTPTQELVKWQNNYPAYLAEIDKMPSGPVRDATLRSFEEKNRILHESADAYRATHPTSNSSSSDSNIEEKQNEADEKLDEIKQKQQELENRQTDMQIKMNNDSNFNAMQEEMNRLHSNDMR